MRPLILRTSALVGIAIACMGRVALAAPDGVEKLIDKAEAYQSALEKEPKRLELRHNLEKLIILWSEARAKARGAERKRALEGEAKAWKLLAHWSGRADDREKASELAKQASAPEPVPAIASGAAAAEKSKRAQLTKLALRGSSVVLHANGDFTAKRSTIPAKKDHGARVLFDLTPAVAMSDAMKTIRVGEAGIDRVRVGQFDNDTARVVIDLEPSREDTKSIDLVRNEGELTIALAAPQADARAPEQSSSRDSRLEKSSDGARASEQSSSREAKAGKSSDAARVSEQSSSREAKAGKSSDAREEAPKLGTNEPRKAARGAETSAKREDAGEVEPSVIDRDVLLGIVDDMRNAYPELAGTDRPHDSADAAHAAQPDTTAQSERKSGAPEPAPAPIVAATAAAAADDTDDDDAPALAAAAAGSDLKRSTRDALKPRDTSLLRIQRVVIDAGHGGKDFGAIGRGGLREKDVNLAVALELGKQLEKKLGVRVIYTRSTDDFVSLRRRAQIANKSNADLFISVHANAHKKRTISGIETYYLNTTSDRYAERLALRENSGTSHDEDSASDDPEPGVGMPSEDESNLPTGSLGRDLRLILADLAMRSASLESKRLAGYVQSTLVGTLKRKYDDVSDLGVKHALFYVLLGARMPSVLIETGFVTNQTEAGRLSDAKYRREAAAAIAQGVARFVSERNALARRLDGETLASVRR